MLSFGKGKRNNSHTVRGLGEDPVNLAFNFAIGAKHRPANPRHRGRDELCQYLAVLITVIRCRLPRYLRSQARSLGRSQLDKAPSAQAAFQS